MNVKKCPKCKTRMYRNPIHDGAWVCLNVECRHAIPVSPHAPGTPPDTAVILGPERRAWLRQQGGIGVTLRRLIDEAMAKENS